MQTFVFFVHLSFRLEALKSNPPFFVAYAGAKKKTWYFQCRSCERPIADSEEESAGCTWRLRVSRAAGGFLFHCTVRGPETGHLPNDRMAGRLQGMFTASEERAVYELVKSVGPGAKTSDVRCAIHQAPTRGNHRREISPHAIMAVREKIFRYSPEKPKPLRLRGNRHFLLETTATLQHVARAPMKGIRGSNVQRNWAGG